MTTTAPSLTDLVTPSTPADALQLELTTASDLGLPITSWQPLDPSRTILQMQSQIVAQYSSLNALIAQGGYLSYAALMVDVNGNPITTWMDLLSVNVYNVSRVPATAATGNIPVQNVTSTAYSWSSTTPLHFQNPSTLATYTTVGSGTIAGSGSPPTPQATLIEVTADPAWVGKVGTSAAGVTLVLLTPLAGVSVTALTGIGLVGADAETNAHLESRCQAKLGFISPNGAPGAYEYVAESLPVFGSLLSDGSLYTSPTSQEPWGVTAPITRVGVVLQIGSGVVNVYVANSAGAPAGGTQIAISNVTWSAGTATVTTASPHGFSSTETGFAIIAGVLGATGVNNQIANAPAWAITATDSTHFTFALSGNPGSYISGGSAEVGDLGMVDAAIQAQCVPDGMTATTDGAGTVSVDIVCTIYISTSSGISPSDAITNIENAVVNYFGTLPIGGYTAESSGIVPWSELLTTIAAANTGTRSVVLTSPAADTHLSTSEIPILGTANITITYVA
jgi:uncharacterized phage protein gp47/JayE